MPNDFFQFKKFRIEQAQTAMKVSTEACILGAVVNVDNAQNTLDIGTGTGLLTLMLAQKNEKLKITAVEIEENAFKQAQKNILNASFPNEIVVEYCSIQDFERAFDVEFQRKKATLFDVIVSNPPFYKNSLLSNNPLKNLAHHIQSLDFEELVESIFHLLAPNGSAWILLPAPEMEIFIKICESKNIFVKSSLSIHHSSKHKILRKINTFVKNKTHETQYTSLFIKDENNLYSTDFQELMKDYYL
jgi:tRNA1Val (adenine37-N6)-methyltransferase